MCIGKSPLHGCGVVLLAVLIDVTSAAAQPIHTYSFSRFAGARPGCLIDGAATLAVVNPRGLAVDPDGTIYFTDDHLFVVRKVTPAGQVVTVAGLPGAGREIVNGAREDARFRSPGSLVRLPDGSLLVQDNDTVRRVMPDGSVRPYAPLQSDFSALRIAADPLGTVFARSGGGLEAVLEVAEGGDVVILAGSRHRGSVDGVGTAARFQWIGGLAADAAGNVYVADGYYSQHHTGNDTVLGNTIRKIAPGGYVSTIAGTPGTHGFADGAGAGARFSTPGAMVIDPAGNVLVADLDNRAIRKVTPAGAVTTAVLGVVATALAIDPAGRLLISDETSIRRLRADGTLELVAGAALADPGRPEPIYFPYDVAIDGSGWVHAVDPINRTVVTLDPTGNVARVIGAREAAPVAIDGPVAVARFLSPTGIAARADGALFVTDGHAIRKIEAGTVTTLAGVAGECAAIDGHGAQARFCDPQRLTFAADGSLYVIDSYSNYLVRRVTQDGAVSMVAGAPGQPGFVDGIGAAARFRNLRDVTLGADGYVYVLDNDSLRRVEPNGQVTTIAGTSGMLKGQSLTAVPGGPFIVVEGSVLKRVTLAGEILPVAGRSLSCGDGVGPAAGFEFPSAVEAAPDGTLFVTDPGPHSIARGTPVQLAAPTITSVSPPHVGAGQDAFPRVTVFGTNFNQAGLEVRVGGVDAVNVDVISDTAMVVSVPTASAPTLRDLSVTTAAGTAAGTVSYVGNETVTMSASGAGAGAVKNTAALLFGAGCSFAAGAPQGGGADPCTVEFPHGSLVFLDAEPAPGSVFTGWSGDCTGHQPCRLTADRALNVSAAFAPAPHARLFSEGHNGLNGGMFDTRIAVTNTSDEPSFASVRYLGESSPPEVYTIHLQPRERRDLTAGIPGVPQPFGAFSTIIESPTPLVVERTMTWDHREYGAHGAEGAPAPALTWYFAEGATHSGFDLFYLVLNPGELAAEIEVTYLLPAPRSPIVKSYQVAPGSRFTLWVNQEDPRLSATDVSAIIRATNNQAVVVERAMYMPSAGLFFGAGHAAVGVTAPATGWTFAEGATGSFFDLFLLLANPGETLANVAVLYALPDGSTVERTYSVAPRSRLTVWVDHEAPALADTAVAMRVESTNGVPVLAERAMWWPGPTAATWTEAHVAPGTTTDALTWDVADGAVDLARGLETYLLVANTSSQDAQLRVTLHFATGDPAVGIYPLAAHTRLNVDVANHFPGARGQRFWARLESLPALAADPSTAPGIAVERATYWDAPGPSGATQRWAAGVCVAATPVQR